MLNRHVILWNLGIYAITLAVILVLRHTKSLSKTLYIIIPIALVSFVYGTKVQVRLSHLSLLEAIVVPARMIFGPGGSLPLGLALGVLMGTAASAALRGPWRQTGDALAIGFTLMQPFGRLGCMLSGCCTGVVCDAWYCVSFGPGSIAHDWHREMGWIAPDAALSLPVHSLPVYFAIVSLALLGVELWMVHRKARPGSVLLLWLILDPLTRLALEQLRGGMPARTEALTSTLLTWLALDALLLIAICRVHWRPRSDEPAPTLHG